MQKLRPKAAFGYGICSTGEAAMYTFINSFFLLFLTSVAPRYSDACCRGIWLGYFSRSISASLWFICGSSFPPAPCFKGTHIILVLVEPDDCLQKGGAQELFFRTGNQAGGYFDCTSHGSHLLMDCSQTQTDLINRRLVDSAVILPSPYSFVNEKYTKR